MTFQDHPEIKASILKSRILDALSSAAPKDCTSQLKYAKPEEVYTTKAMNHLELYPLANTSQFRLDCTPSTYSRTGSAPVPCPGQVAGAAFVIDAPGKSTLQEAELKDPNYKKLHSGYFWISETSTRHLRLTLGMLPLVELVIDRY